MADEFPTEFDVVVIGTGLPESILAAAFSRIGQKVLHIDRNGYYSGRWCSFNLQGVESWLTQTQGEDALKTPDAEILNSLITEEESKINLELVDTSYSHVNINFHIGDDEVGTDNTVSQQTNETAEYQSCDDPDQKKDLSKQKNGEKTSEPEVNKQDINNDNVDEGASMEQEKTDSTLTRDESSNTHTCDQNKDKDPVTDKTDTKKNNEKWTSTRLKKEWRKFNLDLTPKLLYCGGTMVQLLITSDIAKYCEFKTVTRMLTLMDDKLERVPCSRADVFNSKEVSMLEKRMLMKFLTSCSEYDKNPTDYEAFIERPFKDYLESKKLTKNIKHFVQHSIAMATNQTLTAEGLAKTKKFLHSLGRYGNTAFLWPLYGCGELPQSFCRMSAVFGGVYCLKMSASHLVVDKDKQCSGVVTTDGKKISAKHVIIEESSIPTSLFIASNKRYLLRAVLITDKSLLTDASQQLSLLQLPDKDGRYLTTVIELPPSSMSSPSPLYVVHVTKETEDKNSTPETDLQDSILKLFQNEPTQDDSKPVIMWSLYFKREFYSDVTVDRSVIPENVIVIPGPGPEIDIDCVVDQTKDIFEKLMPGEDFLPRPPNPEDIIYIDDAESTVPDSTNKSDFTDSNTDQSEVAKATSQSETENSNQLENNNPVNDQSEADKTEQLDSANSTTDQINETKNDKLETEKDIENKSD